MDVRIEWSPGDHGFAAAFLRDGEPWHLNGALVGMGPTQGTAVDNLMGLSAHVVVEGRNMLTPGLVAASDRMWLFRQIDTGRAIGPYMPESMLHAVQNLTDVGEPVVPAGGPHLHAISPALDSPQAAAQAAAFTRSADPASKLTAGWGWPANAKKPHYFIQGAPESICGRWMFTGPREAHTGETRDSDCAQCRRKLDAAAKQSDPEAVQ